MRELTDENIQNLRIAIGFDKDSKSFSRRTDLPKIVIATRDDKCECCYKEFDIWTRSFPWKGNDNKPYFEVHHVISIGNDNKKDTLDNLVKICPVCHKALKKNVGSEIVQKHYISNIITNNNNVYSFACFYFNKTEKPEIINLIYDNLL